MRPDTTDPIEIIREAIAAEVKTAPADRFDELVRSGLIDDDGNVLRDGSANIEEPEEASNP